MDFGLEDKTVLVTGGSKGIGKGVALAFAREGARVAICARDEGPLEKTALEIKTLGAKVLAVPADVTDPGSAMRVIAETVRRFQGLDVLVNNAGGAQKFAGFWELEDEDWRQAYELNVLSIAAFVRGRCGRSPGSGPPRERPRNSISPMTRRRSLSGPRTRPPFP